MMEIFRSMMMFVVETAYFMCLFLVFFMKGLGTCIIINNVEFKVTNMLSNWWTYFKAFQERCRKKK